MSKLYNRYLIFKKTNPNCLYLFKSGLFYIFLDEDAKLMADELNLKLINLNSKILKCGFPEISFNKYISKIKEFNLPYKIIENIDAENSSNQLISEEVSKYLIDIKNTDFNTITPLKAFDLLLKLKKLL